MDSIAEHIYYHAVHTPSRRCVIDEKEELTYLEYWNLIRKTAAALRGFGIQAGCNLVIESAQNIPYLAVEMALHLLHAVFVPLEKNCGVQKIEEIARETDAQLIISDQKIGRGTSITYAQLAEAVAQNQCLDPVVFPEAWMVSEILFSTGTTGKPKGIVMTHRSSIALAQNVMHGVEMESDTVEMIPTPLNHSHGLRRYYGNMMNGSTVVIMNGVLNINRFYQNLNRYQVTAMDLVPASLSIIFRLSGNKLGEYKDQLRYVQLGSAPLSEEQKDRLCSLLPVTRLYNFYGSTESGCTCILNFNDGEQRTGSIGKPVANAEFITVDDEGRRFNATPEIPGLLASKGPMNMSGYYHDPEETAKVLKDGYVLTSDLAYMLGGYIYLVGRKGDVINVAGNKVAPQEIEETALSHPAISDCACVPMSDKIKGAVPRLFVVLEASYCCGQEEIREYLAGRLESYKVPKVITEIKEIPRTFNGKIKRKELMEHE